MPADDKGIKALIVESPAFERYRHDGLDDEAYRHLKMTCSIRQSLVASWRAEGGLLLVEGAPSILVIQLV